MKYIEKQFDIKFNFELYFTYVTYNNIFPRTVGVMLKKYCDFYELAMNIISTVLSSSPCAELGFTIVLEKGSIDFEIMFLLKPSVGVLKVDKTPIFTNFRNITSSASRKKSI